MIFKGLEDKFGLLTYELGEGRISRDIDLSANLQSGQSIIADYFCYSTSTRELVKIVTLCRELKINFLVVGLGSKINIPKSDFKRLIIKNRSNNIKLFGLKGKISKGGIGVEEAMLEVDSGVTISRLVEYASKQGLRGLENLIQQTGTIGGSLFVNPASFSNVVQIKVLAKDGGQKNRQNNEISDDDIILSAVFKLKAQSLK